MMKKNILIEITIISLFFLSTILFTYPLAPNFGKGILHLGADPLINLWILLWNNHKLLSDPLNLFNANIFFPEPLTLTYSESLISEALFFIPIFRATKNPVAGYNFVLFMSFFLSAYGTYLFARYLSGRRSAGIIAGILFGFFAFRYTHLSQIQLLFTLWLPFSLLFLHRYFELGKRYFLFLSAGFITLLALSSGYYAAYGGLLFIIYFFILLIIKKPPSARLAKDLTLVVIIFALILIFFFYPYYRANTELGLKRRLKENISLSASPSGYIVSRSNLYRNILGGLPVRDSLSPGFAAYFLAFYFLLFRRGKATTELKGALPPLIIFTITSFVLSLGPVLRGTRIKLPYLILYRLLPGFSGLRAPKRFAMFTIFGLSLFAGFGAALLREKVRGWNKRIPLIILLTIIIILENLSIPLKIREPDLRIAPVYCFLAEIPGDFAVLELPLYQVPAKNLGYQLSSRVHFKRLVNGCSGFLPRSYLLLYQRMVDFPSESSIEYLKENYPIRYIIVHLDRLLPGEKERIVSKLPDFRSELNVEARIGNDLVLRLTNGGKGETIRRLFPGFMLKGRKLAVMLRSEGRFHILLNGEKIGEGIALAEGKTFFYNLPRRLIHERRNEIKIEGKEGELNISFIIPYEKGSP